MSTTITSGLLLSSVIPVDSKSSNLIIEGSNIILETEAEYLTRIDVNSRFIGLEVLFFDPITEGGARTYTLTNFSAAAQAKTIKATKYRFHTGTNDEDFITITEATGAFDPNENIIFTGANSHTGSESFSAIVVFSGNNTHSGTETFSGPVVLGTINSTGTVITINEDVDIVDDNGLLVNGRYIITKTTADGIKIGDWEGGNDERVRIYQDGHPVVEFSSSNNAVDFKSGIDLNLISGNIIMANGKGIDFSTTTDGSATPSELFDDYEEGTWTPQYNLAYDTINTQDYDTQVGYYTKIGREVTIYGALGTGDSFSYTGTSGYVYIEGLPFTSSSAIRGAGYLTFADNFIAEPLTQFRVAVNSDQIYLMASLDGSNFPTSSFTNGNGNDIYFIAKYFV